MGGSPNRALPYLRRVVLQQWGGGVLHSANPSRLHWGLPWLKSDIVVRSCGGSSGSIFYLPTCGTSLLHASLLAASAVPPALAVLWARLTEGTRGRCHSSMWHWPMRCIMSRLLLTPYFLSPSHFLCQTLILFHLSYLLECYSPHGRGSSLQRSSREPSPLFFRRSQTPPWEFAGGRQCFWTSRVKDYFISPGCRRRREEGLLLSGDGYFCHLWQRRAWCQSRPRLVPWVILLGWRLWPICQRDFFPEDTWAYITWMSLGVALLVSTSKFGKSVQTCLNLIQLNRLSTYLL